MSKPVDCATCAHRELIATPVVAHGGARCAKHGFYVLATNRAPIQCVAWRAAA